LEGQDKENIVERRSLVWLATNNEINVASNKIIVEVVDGNEEYAIGDNDQATKVVTKALNKHKNKVMEIFAMLVKDDIIPHIVDIENP